LSVSELRNFRKILKPFEIIIQGFFPRLHVEKLEPRRFFNNYLQTYVERDVSAMLHLRDLSAFQKFLILLAGRVGQIVNLASLSNDIGVSSTTLRNWLSVLKASYVIFELAPFFENTGKRLIRSPKIYFTDVGLAAFLLGIHTAEQASRDPLRGNLYENLVVADIARCACNRGIRPELYFYRDSHGNEVDLLIRESGRLTPIEIKSSATFSNDFLKGLNRFHGLGLRNLIGGAVLYNGEQEHLVRETRVFNPLNCEDIWQTLTGMPDKED
jgi:hypothetical protein